MSLQSEYATTAAKRQYGPAELYEPQILERSATMTPPSLHPASLTAQLAGLAAQDERLKPFLAVAVAYESSDRQKSNLAVKQAMHDLEVERQTQPGVDHGATTKKKKTLAMKVRSAIYVVAEDLRSALKKTHVTNISSGEVSALAARAELGIEIVKVDSASPRFENWGKTVEFQPAYTLVVTKIAGVQEIVKLAARTKQRVRVAGFRHTWTELYGRSGGFLLMFLPYASLTALPYRPPPPSFLSELSGITIVDSVKGLRAKDGHSFCKIMAGTTNGQFREWCYAHKTWCIPFNVIMLEVTFGGTNAPICHGAGLSSSTLSDLVVEVEYVDAYGKLRVVNDPEQLRVASGAFGLLGVVISVTLQLDEMAVAELQPVKRLAALAVPPPRGYKIPAPVLALMEENGISTDGQEMEAARADFIRRCEEDYDVEFFWFPYQENAWINTWKKRRMREDDVNLSTLEMIQESLAESIVNSWAFNHLLSPKLQAFTLGMSAMWALPDIPDKKDVIQTYVSEALHFRRGIQNFRVWDMEWEIPIPETSTRSGTRNYEKLRDRPTRLVSSWDAITEIYDNGEDAPVKVALEMRLTGSSEVILAPQRGNKYGTASIEVLTTLPTGEEVWGSFCQKLTDHWTSYTDSNATLLNARPHWAKQWKGLVVHNKPVERYFTEDAYRDAFMEFKVGFNALVGSDEAAKDTLARFADPTIARLVLELRPSLVYMIAPAYHTCARLFFPRRNIHTINVMNPASDTLPSVNIDSPVNNEVDTVWLAFEVAYSPLDTAH
ncbi:hypothetical protein EXIGLDRAFT_759198 [Exidia glandulosa HHB12029]|uniref:FAD-binding PCMH-type domain-containing protein n=1 Tax=Exidia glandulosa HHB12029 TaxID=1314781 RepID=A0A165QAQ7_EXIGL|nr:hypothetical protein EXIGLDRAFT_759198 [Exidia glandulosa HHB12029]